MDQDTHQLITSILDRGRLNEDELLIIRRAFGADMTITLDEADALFALNAMDDLPNGWLDYFVLVMSSFVLDTMPPMGDFDNANAAWLIARIDHDGVVETDCELRLMLAILSQAQTVPDRFEKYALSQVKEAVLNGRGAVSHNQLEPGQIGEAEVTLLKKVLYAAGGDKGIGLSRTEAELLFDLNEATSGKDNHASWQDLFVHGIANYLMMLAPPDAVPVEDALRREVWLDEKKSIAWKTMTFKDVLAAFGDPMGQNDKVDASYILTEADLREAERVTQAEASWLIDRLRRDHDIDDNEIALLSFLKDHCPDIDKVLRPLIYG